MTAENSPDRDPAPLVTSEGLTRAAVTFSFAAGLGMVGAGVTAIFLERGQAGATVLVVFGGFFLVVALMKRIPLKVAIGGATLDASYKIDEAFDVGREGGVLHGYEEALEIARTANENGEDPVESIQTTAATLEQTPPRPQDPLQAGTWDESIVGYRGPTACAAARINYRQLDYWARTHLIEPGLSDFSNDRRFYSREDIVRLRVTKTLLNAGVSLQQIRFVIEWLRKADSVGMWPALLACDGRTIFPADTPDSLFEMIAPETSVFVVNLRATFSEVDSALSEIPGERLELPVHIDTSQPTD